MEFIPETLEALTVLDALDDVNLSDRIRRAADRAQAVAPDLAGISVASRDHGLTFTLVATDEEIAALDAVQYLDSGPCVEAFDHARGIATTSGGLLDEQQWNAFAVAAAAAGIRSTLTFPIMGGGQALGTVNLYGRSEGTFFGKHQALADAVGAWAPGAVTNADLPFTTRRSAEVAPETLRREAQVDIATGMVASRRNLTVDEARDVLVDAAARAGVPVHRLADIVVDQHGQGI